MGGFIFYLFRCKGYVTMTTDNNYGGNDGLPNNALGLHTGDRLQFP